jgi:bifunctional N-acetylglucosamine-1-phosphate-uridyltransferase/glucosamine-1-phosphate-acetyltransferase GlmU-like protein
MSLEQKVNSIQALALQSLTGKADSLNPVMEGSVVFNPASGDNNVFTNNIQSQFNQDVFINRNLTVSGTTFLKSKQVVHDVGTMLSNLNVFGDVVIKNGSLIDQEGTAYFDSISVSSNLTAKGGFAQFKTVEITDLTILNNLNMGSSGLATIPYINSEWYSCK